MKIDKLKKIDQAVLLNVMETSIALDTKPKGKTRQKKLRVSVYATSNEAERLLAALRPRFYGIPSQRI